MELGLIVLGVIALVAILVIGIYNGLVQRRQTCNQGWGDIDTALRQRRDLVPNLVETVKGYAAHEARTLEAVIAARAGAAQAATPEAAAKAEGALSSALVNLMALAEAYPDLKASQNFNTLQHELADIEDKLAATRRAFNAAVADYNTALQAFPAILFAGMLGFAERGFWELTDAERSDANVAPEVRFGS